MPKESAKSKLAKLVPTEKVDLPKQKKTVAEIAKKLNLSKIGENKVILGSKVREIEVIPTGIVALDYILKIGGFPRGRLGMIYGPESSWKSTICLHTIAEAQRRGGTAAYIDAEHTFDPKWAKTHGVDLDQMLLVDPVTTEEALDTITQLIIEGIDVIVLDSLVALAVQKEVYKDDKNVEAASISKNAMGVSAKTFSQWLRVNTGRISKYNTLFLVINQLRDNISGYGNPTSVPGGKAIKYYSSFNVAAKKLGGKEGDILNDEVIVGSNYLLHIDKLKTAQYGAEAKFAAYGSIVDNYSTLFEIAVKDGIIHRASDKKTYTFNLKVGERKIIGKDKTIATLFKEPALYQEVYNQVFAGCNVSSFDPYADMQRAAEIDEAEVMPEEMPEEVETEETLPEQGE